ncbi:hypothetical protein M422DRAFT_244751, partial [Sphaerobolus stellatus SS14]
MYPIIQSLYALLTLIMWPLEPADNVNLLIHSEKWMAQSADGGQLGLSPNRMYKQNNLHAQCRHNRQPTNNKPSQHLSLSTPSSIALSNRLIADVLLTLQASLHHVIVGAMGECTLWPKGSVAGGTGCDGPIQSSQATPMLEYSSKVFAFLLKLGKWEIEFKTIK